VSSNPSRGSKDEGSPLPSFVTRVGLALLAPRRAFELADAANGRAGLTDVATLLLFKFIAVEAIAIIMAAWTMIGVGFMPGLGMLGPRLQATLGFDLIVVFGGGALVTLSAGARRRTGRDFDLAAVAWIPYLVVVLLAQLVLVIAGVRPTPRLNQMITLLGLAILAGWLGMAVRHARQRREPS
jgi:hypothetical protein